MPIVATAFLGLAPAFVIDQDAPHLPGSNRKEMRLVLEPLSFLLESNVRLMYEGSGSERMMRSLCAEFARGHPLQNGVDTLNQILR